MIDIGGINVNNFNTSDKKILEVKNICKTYQSKNGEVEALKNINFDVKGGEFISIIGPSGCGKSTLLSIIAGLEDKTSGEIYIDGKMGYMLQRDNLLEWRTIYKNVLLGLEIKKALTEENKAYVMELLKKYDLYEFRNKYPTQLWRNATKSCTNTSTCNQSKYFITRRGVFCTRLSDQIDGNRGYL